MRSQKKDLQADAVKRAKLTDKFVAGHSPEPLGAGCRVLLVPADTQTPPGIARFHSAQKDMCVRLQDCYGSV